MLRDNLQCFWNKIGQILTIHQDNAGLAAFGKGAEMRRNPRGMRKMIRPEAVKALLNKEISRNTRPSNLIR